jgi:hypothetical protein
MNRGASLRIVAITSAGDWQILNSLEASVRSAISWSTLTAAEAAGDGTKDFELCAITERS